MVMICRDLTPRDRYWLACYGWSFCMLSEICEPFCQGLWPERRTKTCKNVRMFDQSASRKYKAAMFGLARRIVTDVSRRGSSFGTDPQERFHGLIKRTSHNDLRLSRLDFAMSHAVVRNLLRSEVGLPSEFGASNKRQAAGGATFVPLEGDVLLPSVREVFDQLISAMQRTVIEFPREAVDRLTSLGLWPGESSGARQRGKSFIHEVLDLWRLEVNARKRWLTTNSERIRVIGGLGQVKLREGAKQLRGAHWLE
jgi:hypothetical protein